MSQIVILSGGSRGDTQPYVGLGVGLAKAGFNIRIVTDMEQIGLCQPLTANIDFPSRLTKVSPMYSLNRHLL